MAPPRVLSLLAYLIVNRDRRLTRSAVASALWPDELEEDARANLRRHLHRLNTELPKGGGEPWIEATTATLQWNPRASAWIDVVEFERLTESETVAPAAADLFGGEFLAGTFDDWVIAERERLLAIFLDVAYDVALRARAARDFVRACEYADRVLAMGEWREDAARLKIAALYEMGDRPGALAAFDAFSKQLRDDMNVDVMPETRALRDTILANVPLSTEASAARSLQASVPIVGRSAGIRPAHGHLASRRAAHGDDRLRRRRGRRRQVAPALRVCSGGRAARRPRALRIRARGRRCAVPAAGRRRPRCRPVSRARRAARRLALGTRAAGSGIASSASRSSRDSHHRRRESALARGVRARARIARTPAARCGDSRRFALGQRRHAGCVRTFGAPRGQFAYRARRDVPFRRGVLRASAADAAPAPAARASRDRRRPRTARPRRHSRARHDGGGAGCRSGGGGRRDLSFERRQPALCVAAAARLP